MGTELAKAESLNLEKFYELKSELTKMASIYNNLTITDINDKQGYEIANTARKALQKKRTYIKAIGKGLREDDKNFQKEVIRLENELVDEIEPIEKDLKAKLDEVDELKRQEKRKASVPVWKQMFAELDIILDDIYILEATDEQLNQELFNRKQEIAEEQAKRDKEEAKRKHEAELKKQQEAEEQRKAKEAQDAEDERQRKIQLQKETERNERYINYLNSIGYVNDDNHKIVRVDDQTLYIYRKIGEFKL